MSEDVVAAAKVVRAPIDDAPTAEGGLTLRRLPAVLADFGFRFRGAVLP